MKEEIMQKLYAVLRALDVVSVSGKQNLVSLSGSIAVIEEVLNDIANIDINTEQSDDK